MDFKISALLLLITLLLIKFSENSEILGIFPVQSKSYARFNRVIMKNLASRGHRVTVLSYFPDDKINQPENYTDIDLKLSSINAPNFVDTITIENSKKMTGGFNYLKTMVSSDFEETLCNVVFSHPYIKNLLKSRIRAPDLIIIEMFQMPCYLSISEKFKIPTIELVAALDYLGADYAIGNPVFPSYLPFWKGGFTQNMNFFERLLNTLHHGLIYGVQNSFIKRKILKFDQKFVGNENINMERLYRRINLVLYNSHFSIFNRPLVPNAIEVGGIHIKKNPQLLPEKIRKFIQSSKYGVIFFSFGSSLKVSSLPKEKIEMFIEVFSKIPQKVIWRFDEPNNVSDVPENIMLGKWFPQTDILEHKNVKAFISHGGIFGTFEAIHTGTPIVGIPFMFDQIVDIKLLVEKGVAIHLEYETLTHDILLNALEEIINNTKYSDNMQKLSHIFKDRLMPPLDTALYWIEYILRHKGAPHLRTKAADMAFYKYLLLDVLGFLLIVLIFVNYLFYRLFKFCFSIIFQKQIVTKISKKID